MSRIFSLPSTILFLTVQLSFAQNKLEILNGFDSLPISQRTIHETGAAFSTIQNAPITLNTCKKKANNCENRAGFGYVVLNKLGFKPINFWIFKEGLIDGFKDVGGLRWDAKTTYCKTIYWKYHVGAGVIINSEKGLDTLIFDPWTQGKLTTLKEWALSFYKPNSNRTVFAFPVLDNHFYFPTSRQGKLMTSRESWQLYLDRGNANQMYCGLCGIKSNRKCGKNRFKGAINSKREEIIKYLKDNGINL